jgi:hypothetical protein
MNDVIAIEVTFAGGERRYYVTWGRIQHAVDPGPVCELVMLMASRGAKEAVSARVCRTLREAAESSEAPYFYDALSHYSVQSIPFGRGYERWRRKRAAAMERGREIYFCGAPLSADTESEQSSLR